MKSCNIYYKNDYFYVVSFKFTTLGSGLVMNHETEPMIKISTKRPPDEIGNAVLKCFESYSKAGELNMAADRDKVFKFLELPSCNATDRTALGRCYEELNSQLRLFELSIDEDGVYNFAETGEGLSEEFDSQELESVEKPTPQEVGEALLSFLS